MIKIEIGKMFQNKSWRFLGPTLTHYGQDFIDKLNTVFKLAAGIGDVSHQNNVPSLYLVCDAKYQPRNFNEVLQWFRYHDCFITDYPYDTDLKDVRRHMIVFKIPKPYIESYNHLLRSEYSKMFSKEEVGRMFDHTRRDVLGVLLKREEMKVLHLDKVNKCYDTNVKPDDFQPTEYDFPFKNPEEIFNYVEEKVRR
tara:strand:+ start:3962 stop:4549 length:588 start_codon:yes stop_codon:yes gene_type:complete